MPRHDRSGPIPMDVFGEDAEEEEPDIGAITDLPKWFPQPYRGFSKPEQAGGASTIKLFVSVLPAILSRSETIRLDWTYALLSPMLQVISIRYTIHSPSLLAASCSQFLHKLKVLGYSDTTQPVVKSDIFEKDEARALAIHILCNTLWLHDPLAVLVSLKILLISVLLLGWAALFFNMTSMSKASWLIYGSSISYAY